MASRQAIRTSSLLSSKRLINTEKQVDENHSQHNFCENYNIILSRQFIVEITQGIDCQKHFTQAVIFYLLCSFSDVKDTQL